MEKTAGSHVDTAYTVSKGKFKEMFQVETIFHFHYFMILNLTLTY